MNPDSLQRTTDSLLRAFSANCENNVALRFPGLPSASTDAAQLGLATIPTEDVAISPAVVRPKSQAASANAQQYELLLSATAIDEIKSARGFASDAALFNAALGAVINGALLRITSFSTEMVGPIPVLHRLLVSE
jgi:hypothetical protein